MIKLPYSNDSVVYGNSGEILNEFPDKSVPVILADPPYDLEEDTIDYFHSEFMRICSGVVIVFCSPENQWEYPAYQYLFWIKPISTKNTVKHYSRFVEMICIYEEHKWNREGRHWSQFTNTFHDLVDDPSLHPNRKPPSLIERLILNHSEEGDVILDPFFGSGVVGEVCEYTGRHFIGIENDPKYALSFDYRTYNIIGNDDG